MLASARASGGFLFDAPLSSEETDETGNRSSNPALVPRAVAVLVRNVTQSTEETDVD